MGVFETAISAARRRKAKNPAERLATDVLISVTDDNPFLTGTPLMQKARESELISIAILCIARLVATETNRTNVE